MKAKNSSAIKCIILSLCLLSFGSAWAQGRMRVFFSSGKSLVGVVKAHTDEVIVLTTDGGSTYQYPSSDVRAVVCDTLRRVRLADKRVLKAYLWKETSDKYLFVDPQGSILQFDKSAVGLCGQSVNREGMSQPVMLHVSLQTSVGNQPLAPFVGGVVEGNMAVGYRDCVRRSYFVGLGLGYEARFGVGAQQQLLPLFARFEYYILLDRVWSPFVGMDIGYSFGLKGVLHGGPLAQASLGLQKQIGVKHQTFFVGLYFKAQQCGTTVQETILDDNYYRKGTTPLLNGGLRLGFAL